MVGEFIKFDDDTGYDVVQPLAALDLYSIHQPLDHGKMTAIIWYKTPYLINKRDPLFISFALGNDVSLRCVLGLLTLLALGKIINSVKEKFICSEINRTSSLTLDPPGKGISESIVFDNSTPIVPQGVSTNVNLTLLFFTTLPPKVVYFITPLQLIRTIL